VAKLARLSLDEDSVELFTKQVGDILAYMDKLNRLNTEGVPPTSHAISISNVFREDEVRPSISNEAALSNAPKKEDGVFVVPKIL